MYADPLFYVYSGTMGGARGASGLFLVTWSCMLHKRGLGIPFPRIILGLHLLGIKLKI